MHGLEKTNGQSGVLGRQSKHHSRITRLIPHRTVEEVPVAENQPVPQRSFAISSLWIFFILGCAFSIFPIINSVVHPRGNKDYKLWYAVARSVLAGDPLYQDVRNGEPEFMYPPTAAVLLYAPLSVFGPFVFTVILCLLTAASWSFAFWSARVLAAGRWDDPRSWLGLAPGLAVASYIWDVQLLGQLNLFLLALTLGAFLMVRRGSPVLAGSLLGAAAAIKVFPLPAVAFFVVRRQWTAVAATILSIAALVWFLPGVFRGFERNTTEIRQWAQLMLGDQSGRTMSGRSSIGFTRRNQSLVSLSHRLLRPVDAGDHPERPLYINVANVSPMTAQLVGYSACLLLGLVLLVACRFRFGVSVEAEGLEVAMVCTLAPLCSPLAWTYFFCWLLPGWMAIGHWIQNPALTPRVRQRALCGVIVAALLLVSAVSEQFDVRLQAMGVTALGSVALFLTLAYLRFQLPNAAGSHAST